jgi:hypothetical protein
MREEKREKGGALLEIGLELRSIESSKPSSGLDHVRGERIREVQSLAWQ